MNRSQQYIVTYENQEALECLRKKCDVTYNSLVVNICLLDTNMGEYNLASINGVMSAKQTRNRLYSNKS